MNNRKISVYIVEDYKLSRMCIRQALHEDECFDIYGDFDTAEEMLEKMKHKQADLVLMDIGLKGMDGISATNIIFKLYKKSKVVIYTSHKNRREIYLAFKAGAQGYYLKENNPLLIPLILKNVYNSIICIDRTVSENVIGRCTSEMKNSLKNFAFDLPKNLESIDTKKYIGQPTSEIQEMVQIVFNKGTLLYSLLKFEREKMNPFPKMEENSHTLILLF